MDRLISLDFGSDLAYEETAAGILLPIRLIHGDRNVELSARLDTGAADCLFDRFYADVLGLVEKRNRTGLSDGNRFVQSPWLRSHARNARPAMVFCSLFALDGKSRACFPRPRGWLDRVRLGIIHY